LTEKDKFCPKFYARNFETNQQEVTYHFRETRDIQGCEDAVGVSHGPRFGPESESESEGESNRASTARK